MSVRRPRRPVVLASVSPRRRALFKTFGIPFRSVDPCIEEIAHADPRVTVTENARRKALAVSGRLRRGVVVSADTIVVLTRRVFGKPRHLRDAAAMLQRLSGRTHRVYTGVCVIDVDRRRTWVDVAATDVTMRQLSREEIARYLRRATAHDKAGAYAVQDLEHVVIDRIRGSLSNVIGLPLDVVERRLSQCGVVP